MTGKLITIEGIEGSGKTTLINALQDHSVLSESYFTVEPTDWSDPGKILRQMLSGGSESNVAEFFLFMADHALHLEETILPALADGQTVISDRYLDSRAAYQSYSLNSVFADPLNEIVELHQPWTKMPDKTILLDVSPEIALDRLETDDKYETRERLQAIRDNYLVLAERYPRRYTIIDGSQDKQSVTTAAVDEITSI